LVLRTKARPNKHRQRALCTKVYHTSVRYLLNAVRDKSNYPSAFASLIDRPMIFPLRATNAAGKAVHSLAESDDGALATAVLWFRDGLRDIKIVDAIKTYTLEEFAARIVNR
jgi:hypothetical protein